jgi:hypothetical protein
MAQISSFWDPGGQGTELNVARVQYSMLTASRGSFVTIGHPLRFPAVTGASASIQASLSDWSIKWQTWSQSALLLLTSLSVTLSLTF